MRSRFSIWRCTIASSQPQLTLYRVSRNGHTRKIEGYNPVVTVFWFFWVLTLGGRLLLSANPSKVRPFAQRFYFFAKFAVNIGDLAQLETHDQPVNLEVVDDQEKRIGLGMVPINQLVDHLNVSGWRWTKFLILKRFRLYSLESGIAYGEYAIANGLDKGPHDAMTLALAVYDEVGEQFIINRRVYSPIAFKVAPWGLALVEKDSRRDTRYGELLAKVYEQVATVVNTEVSQKLKGNWMQIAAWGFSHANGSQPPTTQPTTEQIAILLDPDQDVRAEQALAGLRRLPLF